MGLWQTERESVELKLISNITVHNEICITKKDCEQCQDRPRCEPLNPPDRDEHKDSPPRLSRPKRTTKPPNNYAREQEIGTEQRKTRSQQRKKPQTEPRGQRGAVTSDDSSTENEDLSAAKLVKELVNLRREIRRRDELHKEELQKVKEEFSAALAEVRHELQTLTDRPLTPQAHSEACSQNSHDKIFSGNSIPAQCNQPFRHHKFPVLCSRCPYSSQSPEQHTDSLNVEHNTNHFHRHVILHNRHLEDGRQ
ncbi:hypothetical protein N7449_005829 [Penicillium cf. viridicatum]|uniref:Uncharacterized protein n=1 Tax=Penicillium cf. viridicatum TaxID=2972119 RepID=A0A9W9MGT9_9EURO|nr:hypothetical protein N7449_005829 [Penicillium cf. viridicatum]